MLWRTGSVYFLGNHCKYFIEFHIVLYSTEHWRFDVNSVNVFTSMAATSFPLQCPVFPKAQCWQGLSGMVGALTWEEQQDPILGGKAPLDSAHHGSTKEPSETPVPTSHQDEGPVCRQQGWGIPHAGVLFMLMFTALLHLPDEKQQSLPSHLF